MLRQNFLCARHDGLHRLEAPQPFPLQSRGVGFASVAAPPQQHQAQEKLRLRGLLQFQRAPYFLLTALPLAGRSAEAVPELEITRSDGNPTILSR